jgi:hypothetical protein
LITVADGHRGSCLLPERNVEDGGAHDGAVGVVDGETWRRSSRSGRRDLAAAARRNRSLRFLKPPAANDPLD